MDAPPLASGCGSCGKKENLTRCAACKVMRYCGQDHQTEHWSLHKSACNEIKRRRITLEKEEQDLRNQPEDFMMPADPFTNAVGNFWGILGTRDYMRARFALIEAMTKVVTVESVQAQLEQCLDILRLCRSDNMGVRYRVPSLMLRLHKDQECYDFIKWWAVISENSRYDWGDSSLPYLDIKDANVFEPIDIFNEWTDFSYLVCLVILKIKLLFDLIRLEQSDMGLGTSRPREIIDIILSFVPQSPIIKAKCTRMDSQTRVAEIANLQAQLEILFKRVSTANKYFWDALLNPSHHLVAAPECYSMGSSEESQLTLQGTYGAWKETPGAIDFVKAKLEGKN